MPEEPITADAAEFVADIFGLMGRLSFESERAAVIVAAARVDVELEKLIKHVLKPHPGGSDPLLDSERPLGTFSARISMAYRLGLIDQDFEHSIQMLRKMRNDFAHHFEDESLSSPAQKSRLREMIKWAGQSELYKSVAKLDIVWERKKPEHIQFVICIHCMVVLLMDGVNSLHRVDAGRALSISNR